MIVAIMWRGASRQAILGMARDRADEATSRVHVTRGPGPLVQVTINPVRIPDALRGRRRGVVFSTVTTAIAVAMGASIATGGRAMTPVLAVSGAVTIASLAALDRGGRVYVLRA